MNLSRHGWLFAGLLGLIASCSSGPDYKKPDDHLPESWRPTSIKSNDTPFLPAEPADAKLKGDWWTMFADEQLNQLARQTLEHNQTLVIASENLNQARQNVTISSSALWPQISLQAGDTRAKTSSNRPLANYAIPNVSTVQNNPQLGLTVSYEADLFGKVRRSVESAKAAEEQAEADFENIRLMLMSDMAINYFNLRELDAEIDIVRKGVKLQKEALNFITVRHDLEAASGLELAQQQSLVDTSKTQLVLLKNQRAAVQNTLSILTGTPAPEFVISPEVVPLITPAIPVGLPANLLQRRPDIASSERAMADANARIGVARSAYFPTTMLLGSGGWDSNQFSNLISTPSILWSLGAAMTQTLFDGGKTTANVNIAESAYNATVANYRQNVLVAMQEVQTGIDSIAILNYASKEAQAAARSSARVLELANYRYSGGLDIYLTVITAQQALLASQRQVVQIQGQQMTNAVFLVKALGGGWASEF